MLQILYLSRNSNQSAFVGSRFECCQASCYLCTRFLQKRAHAHLHTSLLLLVVVARFLVFLFTSFISVSEVSAACRPQIDMLMCCSGSTAQPLTECSPSYTIILFIYIYMLTHTRVPPTPSRNISPRRPGRRSDANVC